MFCSILITFSVSFCLHFLVYFTVQWQLEMLNHFLTLLSMFFTFFWYSMMFSFPFNGNNVQEEVTLVLFWTLWHWCWFLSECFGGLEFCYDKCEPSSFNCISTDIGELQSKLLFSLPFSDVLILFYCNCLCLHVFGTGCFSIVAYCGCGSCL
jgi:hypothetical protein